MGRLGEDLRTRTDDPRRHEPDEKADDIPRGIATRLSDGVMEAISGNVQAAKREAKGDRSKRNLKAMIYLIARDLPGPSPA